MLRPIDKYIVLEEIKNNSSIIMPNESTDKYKVLSVGQNVEFVAVGQVVMINGFIKKVVEGNKTLFICSQDNILCIVEE